MHASAVWCSESLPKAHNLDDRRQLLCPRYGLLVALEIPVLCLKC